MPDVTNGVSVKQSESIQDVVDTVKIPVLLSKEKGFHCNSSEMRERKCGGRRESKVLDLMPYEKLLKTCKCWFFFN